MKVVGYSDLFIQQSAFIGSGFYKPSDKSTLRFRVMYGEGIWLTFRWHQERLNVWCEEHAWRNWIEEKICFCDLHSADENLLALAAQWSLLAVSEELKNADIALEEVSGCASLLSGWSPVVTLNQGNKKLDLTLVDWPEDALRGLVKEWKPLVAAKGGTKPLLRCPMTVGPVTFPYGRLAECQPGAVIMLPAEYHKQDVHFWMIAGDVLIKLVKDNEAYMVSEIKTPEENEIVEDEAVLSSLADINVNVVFDIGSTLLTFAEISALKPGSVIKPDIATSETVNVRVNGKIFATGNFVLLGDIPGVRINKLLSE